MQEGFAILGIAIGVALLFASQVSSTSLTHSVTQLDTQFVGSAQLQLDARGPEGFSERLAWRSQAGARRTGRPAGVRAQVNVMRAGGERSVDLIGVDPHSCTASGPLLRRFSARQLAALQAIALPAPLAREIGAGTFQFARLKFQIGRGSGHARRRHLGEADIGRLIHSPVAVAPIRYAQRLATRPVNHADPRALRPGARRRSARRAHALAATAGANLEPSTSTRGCSRSPSRRRAQTRRCSPRSARSWASCSR